MMEVADVDPGPEWAGVAWVALNRARRQGKTVRQVVVSDSWTGTGAAARDWQVTIQQGRGYRSPMGRISPVDQPRWQKAVEFARAVLAGEVPNPIGEREGYVHPGGMPRCRFADGTGLRWEAGGLVPVVNQAEASHVCQGGRALPVWVVAADEGGAARTEPVEVGRAVFA
jgi:hypothetical protein